MQKNLDISDIFCTFALEIKQLNDMKRLFLFTAIMLSVQLSAQDVTESLNYLKKFAVNDTIKISIKDIEALAKERPSLNTYRELNGLEELGVRALRKQKGREIVEKALSIRDLYKNSGRRDGMHLVYEATFPNKEYYGGEDFYRKYIHPWILEVESKYGEQAAIDSVISEFNSDATDTIEYRRGVYLLQNPELYQDSEMKKYWKMETGDILVFDLGQGELHFAIAISDTEIIHDMGNGVVIDKKDDYANYEIMYWWKQDHDNYYLRHHCEVMTETLIHCRNEEQRITVELLNAILDVIY